MAARSARWFPRLSAAVVMPAAIWPGVAWPLRHETQMKAGPRAMMERQKRDHRSPSFWRLQGPMGRKEAGSVEVWVWGKAMGASPLRLSLHPLVGTFHSQHAVVAPGWWSDRGGELGKGWLPH